LTSECEKLKLELENSRSASGDKQGNKVEIGKLWKSFWVHVANYLIVIIVMLMFYFDFALITNSAQYLWNFLVRTIMLPIQHWITVVKLRRYF